MNIRHGSRKRLAFLFISIFLAAMTRVVARVLPLRFSADRPSLVSQGVEQGLLIRLRHRNVPPGEKSTQYAMELDSRFPYLHLRALSAYAVTVSLLHAPLVYEVGKLPTPAMSLPLEPGSPCPGGGGGGGPVPGGGPCGGRPCF